MRRHRRRGCNNPPVKNQRFLPAPFTQEGLISQNPYFAFICCNGRTRRGLPIDPSAPRPCSAASTVPPSHLPGLAERIRVRTLLFFAFLVISAVLYPKKWVLSIPDNNAVIARSPVGVTWQSPGSTYQITTSYREIATALTGFAMTCYKVVTLVPLLRLPQFLLFLLFLPRPPLG